MNAKEPQPVPVAVNDGKNDETAQKKGRNQPVYVIRQPAPPPPPPPKAKLKSE
jgi:hypothetical protein